MLSSSRSGSELEGPSLVTDRQKSENRIRLGNVGSGYITTHSHSSIAENNEQHGACYDVRQKLRTSLVFG